MVAPIPVAASTSPIRTNIGTTTRMKLLDSENAVVASWLSAPGATKIVTPPTVTIESATATGVRVAIRINKAMRKTVKAMMALIGPALPRCTRHLSHGERPRQRLSSGVSER
jgi:hypothetical protein